ncbi:hypothetical protein, partial [Aphanothece microscopica]|uniref:hypothetical protein n=1 Tax=Aphanothece microscopica TaxID=1049561 RepID=UPI0039849834
MATEIVSDITAGRAFRLFAGVDADGIHGASMDHAYVVQDAVTALRGGSAAVGGYKLAFNS